MTYISPDYLSACVVALAVALAGAGCGSQHPVAPATAVPIPAETISRDGAGVSDRRPVMLGVLVPSAEADVTARLEGTIKSIHVSIGQSVEAGDVLARLSNSAIDVVGVGIAEADTLAAEAEVERATLELQRLRGTLSRSRQLAEQQLISQQQLDDVIYQERLAETQVVLRQKGLAAKKLLLLERRALLADLEVRAAVSGTVAALFANANDAVRSGQAIVRIVRLLPMKMRFAVAPADQAAVRVGGRVTATPEAGHLEIPGVVQWITPEVDSLSQLLIAEASISNDVLTRLAGTSATSLVGRTVKVIADGQ